MTRRLYVAPALVILAGLVAYGCNKPQQAGDPAPATGSNTSPDTTTAGGYGQPAEPFDPVAVNGPIFEDWPDPQAVLLISGEQMGYLEPCGCAGLENQKGGLSRRQTLVNQLREQQWPLALVDLGGTVRRYGPQAAIKFDAILSGLNTIGYEAVGFGPSDLRLPAEQLLLAVSDTDNPFVAANLAFDQQGSLAGADFAPRTKIITAGDRRFGVTAILGADFAEQVSNPDIAITPAAEALAEVLPELRQQADTVVVLSYGTPEESAELARIFPNEIDYIVTAGGADEPPATMQPIEGSQAQLIEVGHKGMYMAALGFYDDPVQPVRYQRVPLDSRFADSTEMADLMVAYQNNLQAAGLTGLGLTPVAHPRGSGLDDLRGQFVGSETCGTCHKSAYATWSKSGHAHATESLWERSTPSRVHDPECLSCHSTGWHPQDYFYYNTGFTDVHETAALMGNGCENCHGPGKSHVLAETGGGNLLERNQLREMMKLSKATAEKQLCIQCHDHDNSPDFNFETYWPKVEHSGKR